MRAKVAEQLQTACSTCSREDSSFAVTASYALHARHLHKAMITLGHDLSLPSVHVQAHPCRA
jgi:hypothetical protein